MMASGKHKAISDDIVRKSKKIELNGFGDVTDRYNSIDFTWYELTLNASYESDNEECQINCGDESCDKLHLYLEMDSDDENETVPDAASSKSAETICDELHVFLDTETL